MKAKAASVGGFFVVRYIYLKALLYKGYKMCILGATPDGALPVMNGKNTLSPYTPMFLESYIIFIGFDRAQKELLL
ncbi:hypothetical protein [Brasilonema sp. UFV-L1]|uniref:hypothetical protein n=1 Tax=Brasilonema sp. UFV-L1 TaxID=2234130 RepID=UPI00145FAAD9|nr:hypothetical protein [Brasilonema sp. UFV-L1]NMG09133.1 hypothetical protein [Brasilonema sp. UFV-L1]